MEQHEVEDFISRSEVDPKKAEEIDLVLLLRYWLSMFRNLDFISPTRFDFEMVAMELQSVWSLGIAVLTLPEEEEWEEAGDGIVYLTKGGRKHSGD